jgi:hypothetical protein
MGQGDEPEQDKQWRITPDLATVSAYAIRRNIGHRASLSAATPEVPWRSI